jgi:hypothetical protein
VARAAGGASWDPTPESHIVRSFIFEIDDVLSRSEFSKYHMAFNFNRRNDDFFAGDPIVGKRVGRMDIVLALDSDVQISSITPEFKLFYVLGQRDFYVAHHDVGAGDISAVIEDPGRAHLRDIIILAASVVLGFALSLLVL